MCQISQMLRDQKNLIQGLADFSIAGKKSNIAIVDTPTETEAKPFKLSDESMKKKMLAVLEKVEGATVNINQKIFYVGKLLIILIRRLLKASRVL
jgi:hypothetical protein